MAGRAAQSAERRPVVSRVEHLRTDLEAAAGHGGAEIVEMTARVGRVVVGRWLQVGSVTATYAGPAWTDRLLPRLPGYTLSRRAL